LDEVRRPYLTPAKKAQENVQAGAHKGLPYKIVPMLAVTRIEFPLVVAQFIGLERLSGHTQMGKT